MQKQGVGDSTRSSERTKGKDEAKGATVLQSWAGRQAVGALLS